MKTSKTLKKWMRNRLFGSFIKIPIKSRKRVFNNNFEKFCKITLDEH